MSTFRLCRVLAALMACEFSAGNVIAGDALPLVSESFEENQAVVLGDCPGNGDCCTDHGGIGCSDFACCNFICSFEPGCCAFGWDSKCAGLAKSFCEVDACSGSGCPGTGDCCSAHSSSGCFDSNCCELVCSVRPACCSGTWSTACVGLADALCGNLCEGDPLCPGPADCCFSTSETGCNDATCCDLVCAMDSFCCTGEWDETCVGRANDVCGAGQGNYCFDKWCPGEGGPCCTAHGTGGCDRSACCETVCLEQPSCCANFWSGNCPELVASLCMPTVCVCARMGDSNGDDRIDLRDGASFQNCFTGVEGGPIGVSCACGDDDGNGTVDLADLPGSLGNLTGP